MQTNVRRAAALIAATAMLGLAGGTLAASPAFAFHITYSSSGPTIPIGTTWNAQTTLVSFTNPTSGGPVAKCLSSDLSGVTGGSGSVSDSLTVTGGHFASCTISATGQSVTITPSFSTAWRVIPTGGTSSPFSAVVDNYRLTIVCGSGSATYSGNLSSGTQLQNVSGGSKIVIFSGMMLSRISTTGGGCPALPASLDVVVTYVYKTVGGQQVQVSHDVWFNPN